jgi:hypothetical protein
MEVSSQIHAPVALTPGKVPLYQVDRRLGGLRVGLEAGKKEKTLS